MNYRELIYLIKSDLYRYTGRISTGLFIYQFLINFGFKYCLYMRLCDYLSHKAITKYTLYFLFKIILRHYMVKYGIDISNQTKIGSGLYIGHFGGITVSYKSIIGKNCNISQNVTIGVAGRGARRGTPTIGDNVYIGPGAIIIGKITIGNDVAIGANCVVTKDIPDNAVVVGIPGKVISFEGSEPFLGNTDY